MSADGIGSGSIGGRSATIPFVGGWVDGGGTTDSFALLCIDFNAAKRNNSKSSSSSIGTIDRCKLTHTQRQKKNFHRLIAIRCCADIKNKQQLYLTRRKKSSNDKEDTNTLTLLDFSMEYNRNSLNSREMFFFLVVVLNLLSMANCFQQQIYL